MKIGKTIGLEGAFVIKVVLKLMLSFVLGINMDFISFFDQQLSDLEIFWLP